MKNRPERPHYDPRFSLHQRQPRSDKLDAQQRRICQTDLAFSEALGRRVGDPRRFAAFLAGMSSYIRLGAPCERRGSFRRRTRDRSCYLCHLNRGCENFERMKAGLAPYVQRSRDGYLDLLERQRAERNGECVAKQFGSISLKLFPTGRLEVTYPDGYVEHDLNKASGQHIWNLMELLPDLKNALVWAGWY